MGLHLLAHPLVVAVITRHLKICIIQMDHQAHPRTIIVVLVMEIKIVVIIMEER